VTAARQVQSVRDLLCSPRESVDFRPPRSNRIANGVAIEDGTGCIWCDLRRPHRAHTDDAGFNPRGDLIPR
jgi:hypothetical protein